jgi:hypothetical protein
MIRDTQRRIDLAARRRDAVARLVDPGPILAGFDEEELPPVARWAVTRAKPGAEMRLAVDAGDRRDPLLVTWQYELGRVAVLPLDFQAGAAGWAAWRGFGKLWAQLARWAARPALPTDRHLEARRAPEGALVRVQTAQDASGPFLLRLAGREDVVLRRVGRREFGAVVTDLAPGLHHASLRAGAEGLEERVDLVVPASSATGRELRAAAPDLRLLAAVAAATGGRLGPEPRAVVAARAGAAREQLPLAAPLAVLALALFLADVALRRLRR